MLVYGVCSAVMCTLQYCFQDLIIFFLWWLSHIVACLLKYNICLIGLGHYSAYSVVSLLLVSSSFARMAASFAASYQFILMKI